MIDYDQLLKMKRTGRKEAELQAEEVWAEVNLKTYRRAKQYIDWYPEHPYIDIALRVKDAFNPESASGLQVLTPAVILPQRYD